MAISAAPLTTISCCFTKDYVGLKLQPQNSVGFAKPSLNAQFHSTVEKCLVSRANSKPTRGCLTMMPIGTPRVPYRAGDKSWQWVDLWNALYRERIIFLGNYLDEEYSNQILATMLYLDSLESSEMMFIYLACPGGDLTPSLSIYDTMQSLKTPVGTHCLGFAINLGGFILAAGEKGKRTMMPYGRVSIAPVGGTARGRSDTVQNEVNELKRIRDYLFKELSDKTGQPVERINKDFARAKILTAPEALEYGIIDRIVRPARIVEGEGPGGIASL